MVKFSGIEIKRMIERFKFKQYQASAWWLIFSVISCVTHLKRRDGCDDKQKVEQFETWYTITFFTL